MCFSTFHTYTIHAACFLLLFFLFVSMLRLVAANKEQNKTAVLCSYRGCTDELSQCRRAAPRRCPSPVGTTSSRQLSSRLLPTITTASALTINIQNNIKNYYCYYYCSALYIKLYNSTAAVDSISSPFRNQQQNMKVDYHHPRESKQN